MTYGAAIFVGAILVASLLCLAGWRLSRRKLANRTPLSVSEIVSGLPPTVSQKDASEILTKIGESFDIQPGLLRLDDPISVLTGMDSWKLGGGQEKLEAWLKARGVTSFQKSPKTIEDLVVAATGQ